MGSGLELSPAATQAICRRRNSKIVYMMLCNNFVHSMPCRNGVERRREKGFTFVWLLRLCCSVCLAPIPRDIQCRFVSHDGRLHIAHRISSTIHEWMACNVQRLHSCLPPKPYPTLFLSDSVDECLKKLCALLHWENDLQSTSWFPAFQCFVYAVAADVGISQTELEHTKLIFLSVFAFFHSSFHFRCDLFVFRFCEKRYFFWISLLSLVILLTIACSYCQLNSGIAGTHTPSNQRAKSDISLLAAIDCVYATPLNSNIFNCASTFTRIEIYGPICAKWYPPNGLHAGASKY